MRIDNAFNIGDTVYLKTDPDQYERLVFSISIHQTGLLYELAFGERTSKHYDFELSIEPDKLKKMENA